eukprot:scaffold27395_cov52-Phaeocystis_antarctica.AAC.2
MRGGGRLGSGARGRGGGSSGDGGEGGGGGSGTGGGGGGGGTGGPGGVGAVAARHHRTRPPPPGPALLQPRPRRRGDVSHYSTQARDSAQDGRRLPRAVEGREGLLDSAEAPVAAVAAEVAVATR